MGIVAQVEQWYRLRDGRGKKAGEVQLRVRWTPRQKSREELRAEDEASLFGAVMSNEVAAVRLLLARGVHINARNAMGLTPYEVETIPPPSRAHLHTCTPLQSVIGDTSTASGDDDGDETHIATKSVFCEEGTRSGGYEYLDCTPRAWCGRWRWTGASATWPATYKSSWCWRPSRRPARSSSKRLGQYSKERSKA